MGASAFKAMRRSNTLLVKSSLGAFDIHAKNALIKRQNTQEEIPELSNDQKHIISKKIQSYSHAEQRKLALRSAVTLAITAALIYLGIEAISLL